jgi:hypothetical protein
LGTRPLIIFHMYKTVYLSLLLSRLYNFSVFSRSLSTPSRELVSWLQKRSQILSGRRHNRKNSWVLS